MSKISYSDLSRTVSHALRHESWVYELRLDSDGWVAVESLLKSLRALKPEWSDLKLDHLEKMITKSDKKRHELSGNKIRALYGHTIPNQLEKEPVEPPEILYHGTAPETAELIRNEGLQPMDRQYVHTSSEIDTAKNVGLRKSKEPVILVINAKQAYQTGISFYKGNDKIWLSDLIPPEFIKFPD
jgi:putative RNA 2'-phosphotransferase